MKQKIYLDNNATTCVDPLVIEVILSSLKTCVGNPSSSHSYGQEARNRLQKARDQISKYLQVSSREIIFTSGATEALNLVLKGFLENTKTHVITSDVEHPAVYSTLKSLESESISISFLPVGLHGSVTLENVKKACRPDTSLIVLMAVNNETGVKTDIESIAAFAKEKGIHFVVDGVAMLGKEHFQIPAGVSAMCFSGHKLHAPKGIGFAFIRKQLKLKPLILGGNQEFSLRGGTENITGIIALQEAIRLLTLDFDVFIKRMKTLRDKFEKSLLEQLPNISVNGQGPRIVNTSNLCFKGVEGELLMAHLDREGLLVSLGSACASGALEPSRVLLNMGLSTDDASSSIRFSLSRFTTEEEIDRAIQIVVKTVHRLQP